MSNKRDNIKNILIHVYPIYKCGRDKGSLHKLPGPGGLKGPTGPDNIAYFLYFSVLLLLRVDCIKLTLSDQTQVTLHPTIRLSDLV